MRAFSLHETTSPDKFELAEDLFVERDDAASFAVREHMRGALVRDSVPIAVRFPREVDSIEIRAVDRAHFVGHRLPFVAARIEELIEHDVSLENGEAPR